MDFMKTQKADQLSAYDAYDIARSGSVDVIEKFISACPAFDVNARIAEGGSTMLLASLIDGCPEVLRYLVEHRQADVNVTDDCGWTALANALLFSSVTPDQAIKNACFLLKHGANPNFKINADIFRPDYERPLLHCVYFNKRLGRRLGTDSIIDFVSSIVDLSLTDSDGLTWDQYRDSLFPKTILH